MLSLFLALCFAARAEEGPAEEMEQGLEEIQPLLEQSDVDETEGMGLEEMTDAFTESAMSEYIDSTTGFSMQYPSIFVFDESKSGSVAMTADRKASLSIDNMINQGGLDEQALTEAIRLEAPDAELQRNEQNGCLRCDRTTDNGSVGQTDLYFLTETSFHHIILRYPSEEKETYFSYIEYMINTMEAKDTDLG
jgi:hypothetical protein